MVASALGMFVTELTQCSWLMTRVSSKATVVMTCDHVMSTLGRELVLSEASRLTVTTSEVRMVERIMSGTDEL